MHSYNYPSSSWDNALQPNRDQFPNGMDPRRLRASTAPAGSHPPPPSLPPSHPASFVSQYFPSTIHGSDLFFANQTPQMNIGHSFDGPPGSSPPPHVPPRPHPHLHHTYSLLPRPPPVPHSPPFSPQVPHLHRSLTSPPIPPKPSPISHSPVLPKLPPKIPLSPQSPPQSTTSFSPQMPEENGDEMAVALALSQSESGKGKDVDKLSSQEEEDLARALEESMISAGNPVNSYISASVQGILHWSSVQAGSSKDITASASTSGSLYPQSNSLPSTSSLAGIADIRRNDSWRTPTIAASQMSDDEAFARRLAAEEDDDEQQPFTVSDPSSKGIEARAGSSASANEPEELPQYSARRNSTQHDNLSVPVAPRSAVLISDDEAYARRLAAEEEGGGSTVLSKADDARSENSISPAEPSDLPQYSLRRTASHESNSSSPASASTVRISDEEYARRLAAEETTSTDEAQTIVSVSGSASTSPSFQLLDLSRYGDAISNSANPPNTSQAATPSTANIPLPVEPNSSRSSASYPGSSDSQSFPGRPGPSAQIPSSNDSPLTGPTSVESPYLHPERGFLKPTDSLRPPATVSSVSLSNLGEANGNETPSPTPASPNQFIDGNLLRGVSLGFAAPSISIQLTPMQGALPNIISLPYGRCPPLHLQAPSWRHLLKLMARLSGTRIEPTVEALAVAKSDPQLRTVIQFVKPHHASPDWRTILWFTIDHPVPASMPGAQKYTNGDVNVLPWSYTLSSLPTLLRNGADSPLSKVYTIPSTESTPYPALPISFPNMAMYLQAALEESRRYTYDSSSGIRRLARMIDMCYPCTYEDDEPDAAERSMVGGLLKRVMGRTNKSSKSSKKPRGRNEDTYELVTPFVPDEWG